jgi:hypothetical protein
MPKPYSLMKNAYLGHGSKIINGMPYSATPTPPSNYYLKKIVFIIRNLGFSSN